MKGKTLIIILFLLIPSLYTQTIYAQNTSTQNASTKNILSESSKTNNKLNNRKQIPQNITTLLNQARSVPPEFCADAIIRIVESKKITNNQTNIELLKEAFEQANQVQLKGKKTVFKSINIDTRAGYLDRAYDLNLDSISLSCRIINTMLELDKNTAKEYFSKISLSPYIDETLSCKDVAIYDATNYYETAKKIAERCFTIKEIEEGFREHFVEEKINNITSPVELSHLASIITAFNWNSLDLEILLSAYSNKINLLTTDYRTFIASEISYRITESIHNLASYCEKKQTTSKYLIKAYKNYIVKNLSQKICSDKTEKEKLIPQLISRINNRLLRDNPIILKDFALDQEENLVEETPFFSSSKSKLILDQMRKLYASTQNNVSTTNNTDTNLEETYSEFLKTFKNWKPSDEPTEEDYLHQKATIYQQIIEIAQTEKQRNDFLYEYLIFLRDFKLEHISRAEWFTHLNFVLKMAKTFNKEEKTKILNLLHNSQNSVAELYASLIIENL